MLAAIAAGLGLAMPALAMKGLAALQKRLKAPASILAAGGSPNVTWPVHL